MLTKPEWMHSSNLLVKAQVLLPTYTLSTPEHSDDSAQPVLRYDVRCPHILFCFTHISPHNPHNFRYMANPKVVSQRARQNESKVSCAWPPQHSTQRAVQHSTAMGSRPHAVNSSEGCRGQTNPHAAALALASPTPSSGPAAPTDTLTTNNPQPLHATCKE